MCNMLTDQFCVSKFQNFNRLVLSFLLNLSQIKGKLYTAKTGVGESNTDSDKFYSAFEILLLLL